MSSSFFTTPASQRKRKRHDAVPAPSSKKRVTSAPGKSLNAGRGVEDEIISSSESSRSNANSPGPSDAEDSASEDSEALETAAERRLKLAERYLENIRAEVGEEHEAGFDAEDVDRELIAARLKEDVVEDKGRVYRYIARELQYSTASQTFFRADTLATLGVAACPPFIYTVSKDISLIKWELTLPPHASKSKAPSHRQKPKQLLYTKGNKNHSGDSNYQNHTASILCVAASSDGKFVATGAADRRLIIWDAHTLKPLKIFTQHRDAVTGLAFRGKTNQLFSSSKDRTVKIWSLDQLAYVETLFGHQDEIVDIAAVGGSHERCISVGARDRTARLWKVAEESQLVFRGGGAGGGGTSEMRDKAVNGTVLRSSSETTPLNFTEGSLDRVTQLDTQLFVTGSDSGSLSLFSLHKKKPLHVYPLAHGFDAALAPELSSAESDPASGYTRAQPTPRWITALKAIPFSDTFVSGSWDGCVKVWRVASSDDEKPQGRGMGQKWIEPVAGLGSANDITATIAHHLESVIASAKTMDLISPSVSSGAAEDTEYPKQEVTADEQHGLPYVGRAVRGVINDLAVFERGERGKGGICIVAAVGTEPRLGRWMKWKGKNGAVVFEVPRRSVSSQGYKSERRLC